MAALLRGSPAGVKDEGHRPVVLERNEHLRPEHPGPHRHPGSGSDPGEEGLVEPAALLGRRGTGESRAPAGAAVPEKGELRDDEQGASGFDDGAVHLAVLVGENAQPGNLAGQPGHVAVPVAGGDPEQDEQTRADPGDLLPPDRHGGTADALEDGPHRRPRASGVRHRGGSAAAGGSLTGRTGTWYTLRSLFRRDSEENRWHTPSRRSSGSGRT